LGKGKKRDLRMKGGFEQGKERKGGEGRVSLFSSSCSLVLPFPSLPFLLASKEIKVKGSNQGPFHHGF